MNYSFNKPVRLERLQNLLSLTTFLSKIIEVKIEYGQQILIKTNAELSVGEQTELNAVIENYSDFDLNIVYDDTLDEVSKFRHTIRKHFGKKNMLREYNPVQVRQFIVDSKPLMELIDNYALTTAIYEIDSGIIVPTSIITAEDINEARTMIIAKLNEL